MSFMSAAADPWVLLQAAGVPGRLRSVVAAVGASAVVQAGQLRDGAKTRMLDLVTARDRCQRLEPFFAHGGRLADEDTLDRLVAAGAPWLTGYARGPLWSMTQPTIAIVGAREAPQRWLDAAATIATHAAQRGALVISGGARGVDRAAHRAALEAGGHTLAVVGEPANARAPTCVAVVGQSTSVLTQHGAWVQHARGLHRSRNAAITALADLTVVVGGMLGGGTWGTVGDACKLGRRLAYVRGADDDPFAAIAEALDRDGRGHAIDPDDPEGLWQLMQAPAERPPMRVAAPEQLVMAMTHPLLRCLAHHGGKMLIDDAAIRLGVSIPAVMADVALLELDGQLRREGALLIATSNRFDVCASSIDANAQAGYYAPCERR
jgi:DNA processing protein